ncbi:MAG: hypothetical protein CSB49_04345 [Proteobacteria bacterium]|nr:MAG: hypothetical protein CSB49_04345 [Pseudomonadota bacterium]
MSSRRRLGAALVIVALVCAGAPSAAGPPNLRNEVYDIEQQAKGLSIRFSTRGGAKQQLAEHRLVDAQVLYNLKDYSRAAILLLDYIRKYPNSRGYGEAVFYLADSLFHKRDFLSARRYFREIVLRIKGQYYQQALQRLVELSLRLGDTTDVKNYLNLLANIPPGQLKASVPYVIGKYYFFAKKTDLALNTFRQVRRTNHYYAQAQYFVGACLVRKKQYPAAVKLYRSLLRVPLTDDKSRHVRDLTHLAIGRLLYQANKTSEAIDQYQKVSRRSKEFDAALYEIAWAYIKAKELQRSLRALDLLVLAQPDSPFVPEVKVLQGNILIRLKRWGRATDLFTKTRDKFVPVHKRMKQLIDEQSDPNVFFDVLLARNLGRGSLAVTVNVPDLAVRWVKERPDVKRAMNLVKDMRDVRESIDESKKLITRLERTVNSPAKIRIFPDFATAARQAVQVENRLTKARHRILEREQELISGVANDQQKAQLAALRGRRAGLESSVAKLPETQREFQTRTKKQVGRIQQLEKKVSKLEVVVQSLKAELIAAEKYFADTAGGKTAGARKSFAEEASAMRREIKALDAQVDNLKGLLEQARRTAGVGGAEEVAERNTKKQYKQLAESEQAMLEALRSGLSGRAAREFDELARLMSRCKQIDGILAVFNAKLEKGVEGKLSAIRLVIAEEKARVAKYDVEATEYKSRTDRVAGAITYKGFKAVSQRFYEIVVRSDVGVIDVAWALKDAKSKEVSALVRQSKRDLKLLDDEFKEVLKDDKKK